MRTDEDAALMRYCWLQGRIRPSEFYKMTFGEKKVFKGLKELDEEGS